MSGTFLSADATAAARAACLCHRDKSPDFIAKTDPAWESCVEYWGVDGLEDWCRGCRGAVVAAAITADEVAYLVGCPWVGEGPSVVEVGGEMLLALLPFRGEIIPVPSVWDKFCQAWRTHDGMLLASWLKPMPTSWRRMPKVRG